MGHKSLSSTEAYLALGIGNRRFPTLMQEKGRCMRLTNSNRYNTFVLQERKEYGYVYHQLESSGG